MNIIKFDKKVYKYESFWRNSKNTRTTDSSGKIFPWPKSRKKWQMEDMFIHKLKNTETDLRRKNKITKYDKDNYKNCLICGQKNIITSYYELNKIRWENGLLHYISKHNIRPSDKFIDRIFRYQIGPKILRTKKLAKLKGVKMVKHNKMYLKLDRNQIMIMDALMRHGSQKVYVDKNNKKIFRYSEHAGILDFDNSGLERIVVSGKTNLVDDDDDDIFLPDGMLDMFDYEYIFHTHPPTYGLGGRAKYYGVLYETPSISDIFHFVEHYNKGNTQGSVVITPEGMYIIRKYKQDNKKIKTINNAGFKQISETNNKMHDHSIRKYGTNINSSTFYKKIAQDTTYINMFNKTLKKFGIYIDYYPRIKDKKNRWVIDTVYVPIYVIEPKS